MMNEAQYEDNETKIQWDLRVIRTQIIARRWFIIEQYKDQKNYSKWFENLHLLASTIKHAVSPKAINAYEQKYEELYMDVAEVTNKYEKDYSKKRVTNKGIFEIQEALLNLGEFLERTMRESGILGDKEDVRGL